MIRLHFWRNGSGVRNFGDELSRVLVEHISGKPVCWSRLPQANLLAVGSLLATHFADESEWQGFQGAIWGTGRMYAGPTIALPQADVRAVRGWLSLERLEVRQPQNMVVGDPGLLANELIARSAPRFRLGVVPHWTERESPLFRQPLFRRSDVRVIDPCQGVRDVLHEIASCEHILSSSLHGLVVADSLGIPNRWLRRGEGDGNSAGQTEFKFRDYYSVYDGLEIEPLAIRGDESMEAVLDHMRRYARPGLEQIRQRLREAFPSALEGDSFPSAAESPEWDELKSRVLHKPMGEVLKSPSVERVRVKVPDRSKCVVLVPVGAHVEPGCEAALRILEHRGYTVRRVRGYSAIDQARNQMATDALANGFEETMWIDSDVVFDPSDVDRLRCLNLPLTCGIYPKKGLRELAVHLVSGTNELIFGALGGVVEVRYAATGFLHVRREVYETIHSQLQLPICNRQFKKPMIPFFQPLVVEAAEGPWYLAEDFAFCERARQCGFTVQADTRIRLWHVGSYKYSWEDAGSACERFASYAYKLTSK